MRFFMKAVLDTEKSNDMFRDGTLGTTIGRILEDQKPEAAYFSTENGKRTAFLFVNFDDPSEVPRYCEPWFTAFNAEVTLQPAMTVSDLKMALPGR